VGATQFAQIPLLNASQLVARWKLVTPPALVSETQQLPIDGLGAGVYLIEATDGTYKAYTVAIVTSIAVVERATMARPDCMLPTARRARRWRRPMWRCGPMDNCSRRADRQRRHGFADDDNGARRRRERSRRMCGSWRGMAPMRRW
jgi:hypothetical protein